LKGDRLAGWRLQLLGELQAKLGIERVEVLALDLYPSGEGVNTWIDYWHSKNGGDVTWAVDGNNTVARMYGVTFLGQTVMINGAGNVVYNGGPLDYESLLKYVEES
jgi:hypothetical protein